MKRDGVTAILPSMDRDLVASRFRSLEVWQGVQVVSGEISKGICLRGKRAIKILTIRELLVAGNPATDYILIAHIGPPPSEVYTVISSASEYKSEPLLYHSSS